MFATISLCLYLRYDDYQNIFWKIFLFYIYVYLPNMTIIIYLELYDRNTSLFLGK